MRNVERVAVAIKPLKFGKCYEVVTITSENIPLRS